MSQVNEMRIQWYRSLVAYGVDVSKEDSVDGMRKALAGAVFGGKIPLNQIYGG